MVLDRLFLWIFSAAVVGKEILQNRFKKQRNNANNSLEKKTGADFYLGNIYQFNQETFDFNKKM